MMSCIIYLITIRLEQFILVKPMQKPNFIVSLRCVSPDSLQKPEDGTEYGSVGLFLPHTLLFFSLVLTKCPHLCGRGKALLLFGPQKAPPS